MKRLLVALVLVAMMMSTALAEVIDLAAMSTDDLIQLRQQITDEINTRAADPSDERLVPEGIYVVGKDIKAGKYVLKHYSDLFFSSFVVVFENLEAYQTKKLDRAAADEGLIVYQNQLRKGGSVYISIEDGQALLIDGGALLLVSENPSWAP